MKYYPIINSVLDLRQQVTECLNQLELSQIAALELSFACPDLLEHLEELYGQVTKSGFKLGLASLIDKTQLYSLKQVASPWLQETIEVFAPALDADIIKTIQEDPWMSQYLHYIPGVYCQADVNALLRAGYTGSKFKIYPLNPSTASDFFNSLQGPYPELRDYQAQGKKLTTITSPRDYQKLRKKKQDWDFQPEQRSAQSVIDYIKILVPNAQVIVSGLGGDKTQLKSLTGYDFVATRMSVNGEQNRSCK